jgi:hypothetical protein
MKKQTIRKPTRGKFSLLRQLCNPIPPHLVPKLARDTGVREGVYIVPEPSSLSLIIGSGVLFYVGRKKIKMRSRT